MRLRDHPNMATQAIDLTPRHEELTIGLGLEVGVGDGGDGGHREQPAKRRLAIEWYPDEFLAADVAVADTNLFLMPTPAGPNDGYLWHVRSLVVTGANAVDTIAGQADVYIGSPPPGETVADIGAAWRDTTRFNQVGLPAPAFYQRGQMVVRNGQVIWCIVSGGTADQSYIFVGAVDVIREPRGPVNGSF